MVVVVRFICIVIGKRIYEISQTIMLDIITCMHG